MLTSRKISSTNLFSNSIVIVLIVIIVIGGFLRFKSLGAPPFWRDEADSWQLARLGWTNFWKALWMFEGNMAFYFLLLRAWLYLGDSAWVIRSLSVIFSVATIPAIYILGNRLFNWKVGLASAALLAVNGFHISYSQEARSYSLVVFLVVLSTYFFCRAIESPRQKKFWVMYTLASALAIYAHTFAVLVLLSQWISLNLVQLRRIRFLTVFTVIGALSLLLTPFIAFLLFGGKGQLDWIQRPNIGTILYFFTVLVGDRGYRLLIAYILVCGFPIIYSFLFHHKLNFKILVESGMNWHIKLILSWLFFPIIVTICVSLAIKPIFEPRYLLICIPPLMILAGQSIERIGQNISRLKPLAPLALIVLFFLSTAGFSDFLKEASHENAQRSVAQYIFSLQQSGDGIIFYIAADHLPFNYYIYQETKIHGYTFLPEIIFPSYGEIDYNYSPDPTKDQIESVIGNRERVWLVSNMEWWFTDNTENLEKLQMIHDVLQEQFQLQDKQQFTQDGIPVKSVELYVRTRN